MVGMLRAVWDYRGFIVGSVKREFQSRYRNSLLGAAWTVFNPLAMIIVYTVIFSQVMRAKLPGVDSSFAYSIYLCSGTITWGLFAEITTRAQNVFLENANLIKKLNFPHICLPFIVILNALLNFAIGFGLFVGFLAISGNFPGWVFFATIPVLFVQIVFSIGLGIALGVFNVFFRDVGQFFGIALQFWFWFTPIVYSAAILPRGIKSLLFLNPMAAPIIAYQGIFVNGVWPQWKELLPFTAIAVILCIVAMWFFRQHTGEMVDEL